MTLQIVVSLIDAARGVIYDRHIFIVQATGYTFGLQMFLEILGTMTNRCIFPTQTLSSFWWSEEQFISGFGQPCPELALLLFALQQTFTLIVTMLDKLCKEFQALWANVCPSCDNTWLALNLKTFSTLWPVV